MIRADLLLTNAEFVTLDGPASALAVLGDRIVALEEVPAREVVDFVRACDYGPYPSPWGVPRTLHEGAGEIGVVRVAATGRSCAGRLPGEVDEDDEGPLVATADEWVRPRRLADGAVLRCGDRLGTPST